MDIWSGHSLVCILPVVIFFDFSRFFIPPPDAGYPCPPLPSRMAFFLDSSNLPPFTCSDAYETLVQKEWSVVKKIRGEIARCWHAIFEDWHLAKKFKSGLPS